jgi:hypothetical protein
VRSGFIIWLAHRLTAAVFDADRGEVVLPTAHPPQPRAAPRPPPTPVTEWASEVLLKGYVFNMKRVCVHRNKLVFLRREWPYPQVWWVSCASGRIPYHTRHVPRGWSGRPSRTAAVICIPLLRTLSHSPYRMYVHTFGLDCGFTRKKTRCWGGWLWRTSRTELLRLAFSTPLSLRCTYPTLPFTSHPPDRHCRLR